MRHAIPVDGRGDMNLECLENFMAEQRKKEKKDIAAFEARSVGLIEIPRSSDVCLGRGWPYQQFPGNLRLAMIIDQHREQYQSSDRPNKTAISNRIVRLIKESNGRFITKRKDGTDGWEIVSDEIAREKVSHGFRTKTKRTIGK